MRKFNIPTADFSIFDDYLQARSFLDKCAFPIVVKADGLAAGKGVFVCKNKKEAFKALKKVMIYKEFGTAGEKVVIEECLIGQEASIICFTDGNHIQPLLTAQDHKAIYDNDTGPNTGGMGSYAPTPVIDSNTLQNVVKTILEPAIKGMKKIGRPYKGILYAGLMLTKEGPKVLEFNCRFGDPETQPQMMLLKTDIVPIMLACINKTLHKLDIEWYEGYAVCVVMASGGYPFDYKKGYEIHGLPQKETSNTKVFHAGTNIISGKIITTGGRVLGITARGKTLKLAITKAYQQVNKISFKDHYFRKDIGSKAFQFISG